MRHFHLFLALVWILVTVVLFLGLKYLARLFFGESILDAVTDQLETVIYGALKEDYCPATGRKWPVDLKSSSPIHRLNPDKFLLPILAEAGF